MNNYMILCKKFTTYLKTKGKQPATIQAYRTDVLNFTSYLQEQKIRVQDITTELLASYQDHLIASSKQKNSIRRRIIGIRQFFRFIFNEQKKSSPLDESIIPQRNEKKPKAISAELVKQLLEIAAKHPNNLKSTRDSALLSLLAYEGIKASEIIDLRWNNFLYLKRLGSLKITGERERIIHLTEVSTKSLREYYKTFSTLVAEKSAENKIFIGFKGKDKLRAHPQMTRHGLKFLLYELAEKANISHLNTENLRHHAITNMISLQKTPEEIQAHLGLKRLGNIAKHIRKPKP
jgi:integrase/recombinase XerD